MRYISIHGVMSYLGLFMYDFLKSFPTLLLVALSIIVEKTFEFFHFLPFISFSKFCLTIIGNALLFE